MDVLRLASRYSQFHTVIALSDDFMDILLGLVTSSVPNCMLVYRIVAHLLIHSPTRPSVLERRENVLQSIISVLGTVEPSFTKHPQWKNVEIAASSVVFNLIAVSQLSGNPYSLEDKGNLLLVFQELVSRLQEEEALFRSLVALGSLLNDKDSVTLARSLDLNGQLTEKFQSVAGKVGDCARQVVQLF